MPELKTDILIVGGGTGGCAAALAATAQGRRVILTEETDWLGGQLTSQMVPPDENPWIINYGFGCTQRYRDYREGVRRYYRDHYPLTPEARANPRLSPGAGGVGGLCHEPRVGVAVLDAMLAFARAAGLLNTRLRHKPIAVEMDGDRIRSVTLRSLNSGNAYTITAAYVIDATELGDLLPLGSVEYVTGAEAQGETGEWHAAQIADPEDVQSLTWCLPLGYDPTPGAEYTIDKPDTYHQWRDFSSAWNPQRTWFDFSDRPLFAHAGAPERGSRWHYRRIVTARHFPPGVMPREVTLMNWPQNDYIEGNIIDKPEEEVQRHLQAARQLSLSLVYYLQTEYARPDGGSGYPGLHLCPEIAGTEDGLAKYPYIRESRRIKALFTVTEAHVGFDMRGIRPGEAFFDSVGVGCYHIDLHATRRHRGLYLGAGVFQIPLGALVPQRVENLLAGGKNLGVTHITNGCYRLHPVEWNIGESAGALAAYCIANRLPPAAVRADARQLADFQALLRQQGVELEWPYPDGVGGLSKQS